MQIKSIRLDTDNVTTLTAATRTFTADGAGRRSNVETVGFDDSGTLVGPVVTILEDSREDAKNGNVRVMIKVSTVLPSVKTSSLISFGSETAFFTGASEKLGCHLVVSLPKTVALALANRVSLPHGVRVVYMSALYQAIRDVFAVAMNQAAPAVPATLDVATDIFAKLGAYDNPLMRGVMGLQPVDDAAVYGV